MTSKDPDTGQTLPDLDTSPIKLLEKVRREGRVWDELSEQYGVDNPDPPWRLSLESTCDALNGGYWKTSDLCASKDDRPREVDECKLDALERRSEEDVLATDLYADVPFPERQLLALAHSMIRRGLLNEEELARRMKEVDQRLNMA
ncbi:MAG: thiocyanate hydrolase subunit beta [Gammaproteobacteria bacterium]|nr:MAG: thiocyanate hydrolase subunit beta [Gammaproteobacteria bacterium]